MKKNLVLGIGILLLSLLNIVSKILTIIDLSVIVSMVGILSFLLQTLKKDSYRVFQIIWIVAQIPLISFREFTGGSYQEIDLLNLAQVIHFKVQFSLTFATKTYAAGANILAIGYLLVFRLLISKELIGQVITIVPDSPNSKLSSFVPIKPQITQYNGEWYTAHLNTKLVIDKSEFDLIHFKRKKGGFFKPNKERQLCLLRLASSVHGHEITDSGFVK